MNMVNHLSRHSCPCRTPIRVALIAIVTLHAGTSHAFRVQDFADLGLGIVRWDAAPRYFDGVERSLDGGLRYSIEGGSYAAFRDRFEWMQPAPTVAEFQSAVERAFADWEAVDPQSGLGTVLYFVPDFDTPVVVEPMPTQPAEVERLNRGAEIDIISEAGLPSIGYAIWYHDPIVDTLTLTSGVQGYTGAIMTGADIRINTRDTFRQTPWKLDRFQTILSHEIGHAIGLMDVDVAQPEYFMSMFYDDNFDNSTNETALATLTNSFAHLVDPYDPDNSPGLMLFEPCSGGGGCFSSPGLDTPGVNIHMESSPTGGELRIGPQADDFAGRQFLYPFTVDAIPGDVNLDGSVDRTDTALFAQHFGAATASTWITGDFDDDGATTLRDLALLQAHIGESAPSPAASSAVPEPTGNALLLCAIVVTITLGQRGIARAKYGRHKDSRPL